jgi:uncharacterized protein
MKYRDQADEGSEGEGNSEFLHDKVALTLIDVVTPILFYPNSRLSMHPTSSSAPETVVVLGASDQPERYSHQAVSLLLEHGHRVIPVHPALTVLLGLPVVADLAAITEPVDTLTLYLAPERLQKLIPAILALHPQRVIFNPGTECPQLQQSLDAYGIAWQEACTLVLLRLGKF